MPLTYTKYFTKDFIMLILNTFTNLHTLQLDQIKEIEIDDILLQKLLLSALKELNLYIRHFSIRATTGIFENFMANHTLETLTLCVTGTRGEKYENLFAIFVQNFLNIRDLTIHFPTDTIMQHIFKYQVSQFFKYLYIFLVKISRGSKNLFFFFVEKFEKSPLRKLL